MPMLAVVVVLSRRLAEREAALRALRADPWVTPGVVVGDRLPLLLETRDRAEDKAAWAALRALPGILSVRLVYVGTPGLSDWG